MLTLSILCVAAVALLAAFLALICVPVALVIALLPWLLRLAAAVLLIKALTLPFKWTNYVPAAALLVLALLV